jgi:hypothetical protein
MEKNHMVEIIRRDGSLAPVVWLGFICNAGTFFLNGALAKMEAFEISADDGSSFTKWTRVPEGEHVLCWRVACLCALIGRHANFVTKAVGHFRLVF